LHALEGATGERRGLGDHETAPSPGTGLSSGIEATLQRIASFVLPEKLDYENLVPIDRLDPRAGKITGKQDTRRFRDGFKLTDERMTSAPPCTRSITASTATIATRILFHGLLRQGQIQKNPLGIALRMPARRKIHGASWMRSAACRCDHGAAHQPGHGHP